MTIFTISQILFIYCLFYMTWQDSRESYRILKNLEDRIEKLESHNRDNTMIRS